MSGHTLSWKPIDAGEMVQQERPWGVLCSKTDESTLGRGPAVVVLGAFDGLHIGHQTLVRCAVDEARRNNVPCVCITFDPDPCEIVQGRTPGTRLISTADRRAGLLSLGVDYVASMDFTPEVAALSPRAFVQLIEEDVVSAASVHVGTNFRFGSGGRGDVSFLRQAGALRGFGVCAHELVAESGESVSATRIRELLHAGQLSLANDLLGRCHYIRGKVEHGRGEGTSFGFPTANVVSDLQDCMPAEGVYACYVCHGNDAWPAAANVGAPPTFGMSRPAFLEANLIGFEGDLYGETVSVSFVEWLRASRSFDSLEELERTVLNNIAWVRTNLGSGRVDAR